MGAVSIVLAAVALGIPRSSVALDPRAAECGVALVGSIKSQIALDRGSDYRKTFPKMGYSPELENSSPVFFVVYEGPTEVFTAFGGLPAQNADGSLIEGPRAAIEVTGVVCAITEFGRIIYTDVDTSQ